MPLRCRLFWRAWPDDWTVSRSTDLDCGRGYGFTTWFYWAERRGADGGYKKLEACTMRRIRSNHRLRNESARRPAERLV
jgi:hypothetical protein